MEALFAQKKWGYEYRHLLKNKDHSLKSFNLEQQADISRDYYLSNRNNQLEHLIKEIRFKSILN